MDYLGIIKKIEQESRPETPKDWLSVWRELAAVTNGITRDDPRFEPVLAALNRCDEQFLANDWAGFQQAAEQVRAELKNDG
jgi:hypothetical protein